MLLDTLGGRLSSPSAFKALMVLTVKDKSLKKSVNVNTVEIIGWFIL